MSIKKYGPVEKNSILESFEYKKPGLIRRMWIALRRLLRERS